MDTNTIYQHAPNCLPEDMDGETLVYNPSLATTLHLDQPSTIVWGLCTGEHSVEEIIESVCELYPDQAKQVRNDIIDVVNELVGKGFLVEAQSS